MNFKKVIEEFTCENCSETVAGNGYTNHCPRCLHSKHVDDAVPGDRKSKCQGVMLPVSLSLKGGQPYKILFRCQKCATEHSNKVAENDDIEALSTLNVVNK